jgi:hypothetical protein
MMMGKPAPPRGFSETIGRRERERDATTALLQRISERVGYACLGSLITSLAVAVARHFGAF